ncbi:MAG: hypothetical protein ACHRXM_23975 [Isosphaerales bacterium]
MFSSFAAPGRPSGRLSDRRRARPSLEELEGRELLASGSMASRAAALVAIDLTASHNQAVVVDAQPPSLEDLVIMARQQDGTQLAYTSRNNILTTFRSLGWCCVVNPDTGRYQEDLTNIIRKYPNEAPSVTLH